MTKLLIAGATAALAHEAARLFARDGAELFLIARNAQKLETVKGDLLVRGATKVETYELDLNDLDQHQTVFDLAVETLDGLDAILIAHGTLGDQQASQESVEVTLQELKTNFLSPISLATIAANYLRRRSAAPLR